MIYNHITDLIGNTPLLLIPQTVHKVPNLRLYAKLEYYNPFGSLKDRFAWHSIKDKINMLSDNANAKILESSSWNTIKALTSIANTFNIPTKTLTNRIKVSEQYDMLNLLWVEIEQLPFDGECIDIMQDNSAQTTLNKECLLNKDYLYTDQYTNKKNIQVHFETTWPEIFSELPNISYFFSALGTTWSSAWITEFLRSKISNLLSVWFVSDSYDFIPGIRTIQEMQDVGIFKKDLYDTILEVNSLESLYAMMKLIKGVGMLAWPTTWANFQWILQYFAENPIVDVEEKTAVFLACDRVEPYLSYIKQRVPHFFSREEKITVLSIDIADQKKYAKSLWSQELYDLIYKKKEELLLVDTRSNKAYILWHIEHSINIELTILEELINRWNIFDKSKKVILICPLWKQTQKICAYYNKLGFEVYNLQGWIQSRKKNWYSLYS
jgi:cysteine synthase/rhodanese-related sulfurtransferase